MTNPLDGILPDLTILGVEFTQTWQKLAGAGWGIAILVAVAYLAAGLVGMAQSRGGSHPNHLREAKSEAIKAGWALGSLVALPVIVGAILLVFGG